MTVVFKCILQFEGKQRALGAVLWGDRESTYRARRAEVGHSAQRMTIFDPVSHAFASAAAAAAAAAMRRTNALIHVSSQSPRFNIKTRF